MFESYYLLKGKEASAKLRAKTVMEHTAKMGEYYYNVGVQDFSAGLDFIKQIKNTSNVYFLSSNIYDENTNNLLFNDHKILERDNLKIGIFGVARELQTDLKGVRVENYTDVAAEKIQELRSQVDLLVMLINATKKDYDPYMKSFAGVDYIFSSLEASQTRPEIEQPLGKPYQYQLGIQGKNIGRCDIYIVDKTKPIRDVSTQMAMINYFSHRLNKLQEKDPKRKIEDIYKNSPNVLSTVERLRTGIESAKSTLSKTVNRSSFKLIALDSSVPSEKAILQSVNEVLETCTTLDKKSAKNTP